MRPIDAKALEHEIKEIFQNNPFLMGILLRWVRRQPTIEGEFVRHGRWISGSDKHAFMDRR